MEKITKREMYQALIRFAETGVMSYPAKEDGVDDPIVTNEELKAFAENEIVLLDKKLNKAKENAKKKRFIFWRRREINSICRAFG